MSSWRSCILRRWCASFPIGNIKGHVTHEFLITVALPCRIYIGNSLRQHTAKRHLKQVETIAIPTRKTDLLHQELSSLVNTSHLRFAWESDRVLFCVVHSTDLIKVYTLARGNLPISSLNDPAWSHPSKRLHAVCQPAHCGAATQEGLAFVTRHFCWGVLLIRVNVWSLNRCWPNLRQRAAWNLIYIYIYSPFVVPVFYSPVLSVCRCRPSPSPVLRWRTWAPPPKGCPWSRLRQCPRAQFRCHNRIQSKGHKHARFQKKSRLIRAVREQARM